MDEPVWLTRTMIEVLHTEQVIEHGGALGIRDEGLLESALARPRDRWGYAAETDLAILAAAYGFGLAKNHPFLDGNKRSALVAVYTFLAINDLDLDPPETEAAAVILGLADGSVSEEELAGWIQSNVVPWVD